MPAHRKVSDSQTEALLNFMSANREFAKGTILPEGTGKHGQQWDDLGGMLNNIGAGVKKTGKEWRLYWNNLKYKVRCKMNRKKEYLHTLGGDITLDKNEFKEEEWKIMDILGTENMAGEQSNSNAFGSFAEEDQKLPWHHVSVPEPGSDQNEMAPPKMVSSIQMEILLDNMERNYEMAMNSAKNNDGRENICRKWAELAEDLNNAGDGCTKSADKWRKYWAERKYTVKRKLWDFQKKAEDGRDNSQIKMTAEENRILSIIGPTSFKGDNLDGTATADNDSYSEDTSFKRIKLSRSDSFDRSDSPSTTSTQLKFRPIAPAANLAPVSTYAEIRIDRSNYAEPNSKRPLPSGRSQQFEEQCLSELSKIGNQLQQMVHLLGVLVEQNNSHNVEMNI